MTREEAIKDIQENIKPFVGGKSLDMAIEALSAQSQWIPCSERLPEYDETSEYLVTDTSGSVRHCFISPCEPNKFRTVEEGMTVEAVAWTPCPEPWKGGVE